MSVSCELTKRLLGQYCKTLKKDFLNVLVKVGSIKMKVCTKRSDWRTKEGMILFLANNWESMEVLIQGDTFFRWFCEVFERLEKLLSDKSFAQHIFMKWDEFGGSLKNPECIAFIQYYANEIKYLIMLKQCMSIPVHWARFQYGNTVFSIIQSYLSGPGEIIPVVCTQPAINNVPDNLSEIAFQEIDDFQSDFLESWDSWDTDL